MRRFLVYIICLLLFSSNGGLDAISDDFPPKTDIVEIFGLDSPINVHSIEE